MQQSIGVDIGGTNIRIVITDENGHIRYSKKKKTKHYVSDYLRNMNEMIAEALGETDKPIAGIGIGVPGTVDVYSGTVIISTALGWKDFNVKNYIEDRFKLPVEVENDSNVWTIAEKLIGAGRNIENFVMITIGTGIGAGLYINDKLYRGANFQAGEIGYFPIGLEAYGEKASFKDFGFFEKKASAHGVSSYYMKRTNNMIDCKEIFQLSREGEHEAYIITEEVYKYLGVGISTIICLLNPEKIIFGGGMSKEGELFISKVKEKVEELTPMKTTFQLSETGHFGGAIGSGLLIFKEK